MARPMFFLRTGAQCAFGSAVAIKHTTMGSVGRSNSLADGFAAERIHAPTISEGRRARCERRGWDGSAGNCLSISACLPIEVDLLADIAKANAVERCAG